MELKKERKKRKEREMRKKDECTCSPSECSGIIVVLGRALNIPLYLHVLT